MENDADSLYYNIYQVYPKKRVNEAKFSLFENFCERNNEVDEVTVSMELKRKILGVILTNFRGRYEFQDLFTHTGKKKKIKLRCTT